jgi:phosphate transport system substrate-binding protein
MFNKKLCLAALSLAVTGSIGIAGDTISVTGAGATFPYPIYGKWFEEFRKSRPDVQINYQSVGSGAGIKQLTSGTVDFGASDKPMSDEELKATKVPTLHFPTVLGAVVPIYNIPEMKGELKLTGEALAGIYLGKITKWNDKALAADNPGLPDKEIVIVHRSDSSGTTFIWTDYLSKVSPEWKSGPGANAAVKWPVGLGGKGNEGVTGLVKQTPYAIGYVEMIYALQNKMGNAAVKNASGKFVHGELANVTAAAAGAAKEMPADYRVSITNGSGKDAYPIASFTWLLIPSQISDPGKKKAVVDFLKWMVKDGQKLAEGLNYAPLPKEVAARVEKSISMVK